MAKVKMNPILMGLRGAVGDLVFRHYGDEVFISRKPDMSKVVWSEKQLVYRERFRAATVYAKVVMGDEGLREVYEVEAKRRGRLMILRWWGCRCLLRRGVRWLRR